MPAPFAIAGWFVERGGQFIPARFAARFGPHDVTFAGYMNIFAARPNARYGNFYFDDLTRLNPARRRETYTCFTDIVCEQSHGWGYNFACNRRQS